jgi:O-methyltransferase involved in polyketide biosynthesis
VASAQAAESASEQPLFDDPYAQMFIDAAVARGWSSPFTSTSAGPQQARRIQTIRAYAAARTKWFDEFFASTSAAGIHQGGDPGRRSGCPGLAVVVARPHHGVRDRSAERVGVQGKYVVRGWCRARRHACRGAGRSASGLASSEQVSDVSELFFIEPREEVAHWLTRHGWQATVTTADELATRYKPGLSHPAPDVGSEFVDGQLILT